MTITLMAIAAVSFAFFGWAVVRGGELGEKNLREVVLSEGILGDDQ